MKIFLFMNFANISLKVWWKGFHVLPEVMNLLVQLRPWELERILRPSLCKGLDPVSVSV